MNYDVVVIGAGLSGLMAALASAERGKKTVVVARGLGIITIFTGAIDVLGYYPGDAKDPLESPIKGIEEIIGKGSNHPYARVGIDFVKEGITSFLNATKDGGVEYVGDTSHNFLVPTAVGTIKPTSLLSSTMAAGEVLSRRRPLSSASCWRCACIHCRHGRRGRQRHTSPSGCPHLRSANACP